MEPALIQYLVDQEVKEDVYCVSDSDKNVFNTFINELNEQLGTDYHYLTEIDNYRIQGSGTIVAKYIPQIMSETVRSYMMGQMVEDRIPGCSALLYEMYLHFKTSNEYIAKKGYPSPAHICVRYDHAFKTLKPKRLKDEFLQLADCPRDAYYLPFTVRMLASWRIPEVKDILVRYLYGERITHKAVDLPLDDEGYAPSLCTIQRDLKFTALAGLKYYPSEIVLQLVQKYTKDPDKDVEEAAQKAVNIIKTKLN